MDRRDIRSTVVQLHPHGISPDDADTIEMVIRLFAGEEISIRELEVTDEPLASIRRRMQAELGAQISESAAWRFPVLRCIHRLDSRKRSVLVLIDQGRVRVFFHKVETL